MCVCTSAPSVPFQVASLFHPCLGALGRWGPKVKPRQAKEGGLRLWVSARGSFFCDAIGPSIPISVTSEPTLPSDPRTHTTHKTISNHQLKRITRNLLEPSSLDEISPVHLRCTYKNPRLFIYPYGTHAKISLEHPIQEKKKEKKRAATSTGVLHPSS